MNRLSKGAITFYPQVFKKNKKSKRINLIHFDFSTNRNSILVNKSDLINGTLFVRMIGFYALIYRTYTDGKSLRIK
jgi:hypothetical protein